MTHRATQPLEWTQVYLELADLQILGARTCTDQDWSPTLQAYKIGPLQLNDHDKYAKGYLIKAGSLNRMKSDQRGLS